MRTTRIRLAAGAAVLALALAACSGGGGDDAADTSATGSGGGAIRVAVTDPVQLIPGRQSIAFDFAMAVWAP